MSDSGFVRLKGDSYSWIRLILDPRVLSGVFCPSFPEGNRGRDLSYVTLRRLQGVQSLPKSWLKFLYKRGTGIVYF